MISALKESYAAISSAQVRLIPGFAAGGTRNIDHLCITCSNLRIHPAGPRCDLADNVQALIAAW
jgi:hypothetical protein